MPLWEFGGYVLTVFGYSLIYTTIALIATTYWFAYFLVILPLLGVIEKPLAAPATIEDDFKSHYGAPSGTPAE